MDGTHHSKLLFSPLGVTHQAFERTVWPKVFYGLIEAYNLKVGPRLCQTNEKLRYAAQLAPLPTPVRSTLSF